MSNKVMRFNFQEFTL